METLVLPIPRIVTHLQRGCLNRDGQMLVIGILK